MNVVSCNGDNIVAVSCISL